MQQPTLQQRYCVSCHQHTTFRLKLEKKRKASENSQGQRRFREATSGYGGFPRPKPSGREKPTRRISLIYTCQTCHKSRHPASFRAKKFELTGD